MKEPRTVVVGTLPAAEEALPVGTALEDMGTGVGHKVTGNLPAEQGGTVHPDDRRCTAVVAPSLSCEKEQTSEKQINLCHFTLK